MAFFGFKAYKEFGGGYSTHSVQCLLDPRCKRLIEDYPGEVSTDCCDDMP